MIEIPVRVQAESDDVRDDVDEVTWMMSCAFVFEVRLGSGGSHMRAIDGRLSAGGSAY